MNDLFAYDSLSIEDRIALTTLCMEYVWRLDFLHVETVVELFTDDCVWEGPAGKFVGKPEMAAYWNRRAKMPIITRHMISNLRFVQDSPTSARGWISFTAYVAPQNEDKPATPKLVAEHIDTYEKGSDGKWRIKTRKVETAFGGL